MEEFRAAGLHGVYLDGVTDVLGLLFADDFIMFGDSRTDAQAKLNVLAAYCKKNDLEINRSKTKVIVFRPSPRGKRRPSLLLDGEPIDYSNSFTYLGVPFSCVGKFRQAAEHFISRGTRALGKVKEILVKGKSRSWDASVRLFDSIVAATALYSSELWALRHMDEVERLQLKYIKSIFHLPFNTPNHFVRLEFGGQDLRVAILKRTINWWTMVMSMELDALERKGYEAIIKKTNFHPETLNDAWFSPLHSILSTLGKRDVFQQASQSWLLKHRDDLIEG